jgi:predicted Zn-dependent protease
VLGKERIEQVSAALLARSTADQTEVGITVRNAYLTRFANSTIHQNVAERDTEVRIRAVDGSRVGAATTNSLDDEALAQALEKAQSMARLQPENPDFKSLPGPHPIPDVVAFSDATASSTPGQRARGVGAICLMARHADVVAAGALATAVIEMSVVNSLGVSAYVPATYADINTVIMSDTSAGYASALALDLNDLDFEAIGREALEKCLHSQGPRALEPGEYPVVLEPYAVQDFVQMMSYVGFGAVAFQEGRSFMTGKLGQQIADARISIWDDGLGPDTIPWPFDVEGVPKQRVDLIENGIARGVVYDSYSAGKEEGKTSTGHALPPPNALGPFPLNAVFAPGDATLDDMIGSTERGIYVTRFHYTRPVEPSRVVITGMTRDGTFLIENGKIAYPVRNLRFTQSYLEALNHVEMVGREARLLAGIRDIARVSVPALKLSAFSFTGVTEF